MDGCAVRAFREIRKARPRETDEEALRKMPCHRREIGRRRGALVPRDVFGFSFLGGDALNATRGTRATNVDLRVGGDGNVAVTAK